MNARRFLPGRTYLVTRRTVQRTFLLRPSRTVNEAFLYCLAYAAQKFKIDLHAYCVMSNHMHLVLTDSYQTLSGFMHWLDLFSAKCVNRLLDRWESVWVDGSYDPVELVGDEAIIEKIVYTLNNPVKAGQVRFGSQWPGLRTRPQDIGKRELVAERPRYFFSKAMPNEVRLQLKRPPCYADLDDEALRQHIAAKVKEGEEEIQAQSDRKGRKFAGAKAVRALSPHTIPTTRAPRRSLRPRVACRDKQKRIAWLKGMEKFLKEYREALQQFSNGVRDVVFPAGTYMMRVRFAVCCHDPPD